MKVLSILQPWASLVVLGHKKIETRSWNTKYRGELLIHASMGKQYRKLKDTNPLFDFYYPLFAHGKIDAIDYLPFGAIIGKVNLIDTAPTSHFVSIFGDKIKSGFSATINGDQEKAFGDYSEGRFGWLLSDPVLFDKPIPAKGQLGLWNFTQCQDQYCEKIAEKDYTGSGHLVCQYHYDALCNLENAIFKQHSK